MNKRKLILTFLIILASVGTAFATGVNVYFGADSIKDRAGNTLSAANYHNYLARLEYFHNVNPTDPKVSTSRLADATVQPLYSLVGGQHKYQLASLDGGTLYVRIWKDAPSGDRKGNYYGIKSNPVASGATPPYDWTAAIAADHKADLPYKPTIGAIQESMVRVGNDLKLKLVIPVGYDQTGGAGGDGIREAQSFSVLVKYPDGTSATKPGSSVSLDDTAVGTYKFTPTATNWYGSTTGDEISYTTLSATPGGPDTAVYSFLKLKDGLGLNVFPVAYANVSDPAITNVKQLVEAVNAKAGKTVVTALGWWDAATMTPQGYIIEIDPTTQQIVSYIPSQGAPGKPEDAALVKDMVYQVSVTEPVAFSLTGTR